MPTLPSDIAMGILCRLPVKSVLRCTSVCKSWNSLIREQYFVRQHLSKSRLVLDFALHYDDQGIVACDGLVLSEKLVSDRKIYSISNPSLRQEFCLPYTRENPTQITLFYAPSSGCYKVSYLYHSKKNHLGQEFTRFEIFTLGVDNSWRTLDIPGLQDMDRTEDTFWFVESYVGHFLHIGKVSTYGSRMIVPRMITIDLDLERYTSDSPSIMLKNCEGNEIFSTKEEYTTIIGFMQGKLQTLAILEKEIYKFKLLEKLHFKEVRGDFGNTLISIKGEGLSCTYNIKKEARIYTSTILSRLDKHHYPSLVTFKGMKPIKGS